MITVCHMRALPAKMDGLAIYVGRPTPLGNQWSLGHDGSRDQVIHKFTNWLDGLASDHPARTMLYDLKELSRSYDLYLLCWCKPQRCHADVIKARLEAMP